MTRIILQALSDIPLVALCNVSGLPSLEYSKEKLLHEEANHRAISFPAYARDGHYDEATYTLWLYLEKEIPENVLTFYAQTKDQVGGLAEISFSPIIQQTFYVEQGGIAFTGFQLTEGQEYIDDCGEKYPFYGESYMGVTRTKHDLPAGKYLISIYPLADFTNEQYNALKKKNEEGVKQQFISEFGQEGYDAYMQYKRSQESLKGCLIYPLLIFALIIYGAAAFDLFAALILFVGLPVFFSIRHKKQKKKRMKFKSKQERYNELKEQYLDPYTVGMVASMYRVSD